MKRVIVVAAIVALAGCGGATGGSSGQAASGSQGGPAPAFSLPTSTGTTLASASLKGKPVYLNFFASWCGPCQEEANDIGKLARKYSKAGLVTVGVDELETPAKAEQFRKDHDLPYQAVVDPGTLRDAYNVNGLPVHIFIDRSGTIATLRVGEMSKEEIDIALRDLVAKH
jgi:cytochrome c biogenesis protein CcmG/thiol:disulfide interchange protein DsbE